MDEFFKIIDFNNSEEILSKIKYQKTDTNDNRHKIKIHKNIVEFKNKNDNLCGVIPQQRPKCYNIDRTISKFNILTSKIDNSNKILEIRKIFFE